MRGNYQPACLSYDLISSQNVCAGAGLRGAAIQLVCRDIEGKEYVLKMADRGLWRKQTQNVKAKCRRKLKSGQHQHLVRQLAPFRKSLTLLVIQSSSGFQVRQPFNLLPYGPDASHRVVVGDSYNIETLFRDSPHPIQVINLRIFIVAGSQRMQVQISLVPLALSLAAPG